MKTIEELYEEVKVSEELKREFIALKPNEIEEFAKKNGCVALAIKSAVSGDCGTAIEGDGMLCV